MARQREVYYVDDFGLSGLTGKVCSRSTLRLDEGTVLALARHAAAEEENDRLGTDVQMLMNSPLLAEDIHALWLAGVRRCFDPVEGGTDLRAWLRRLADACSSTAAAAVADQFVEELEPEAVLLVRRDAGLLLEKLPPDRITELWQQGVEEGERFYHRGGARDGAEWMRQVLGVCDGWLSRRSDTPALSGTDRFEGRDLADQVLSVVEEFRAVLGEEVTDALADCVRRCTPDLTFRLLLQVLPTRSASLSPEYLYLSAEQYARLEALGVAFRYGEYVVSDIKYLVGP